MQRSGEVADGAQRRLPPWTVPVRIAVVLGLIGGLVVLASGTSPPGAPTSSSTLVVRAVGGAIGTALVLGFVVAVTRWIEHRRLRDIGLPPDGLRGVLAGVAAWLLPAAIAFTVVTALTDASVVRAPVGELVPVVLLVAVAVLLSEAVPEELVFRGYVTSVLGERLPAVWTIVVQAALFTMVAVVLRGGADPLELSMLVAMGGAFGYLRLLTGGVWVSVGFHLAFQTGSQLVLTHDVVVVTGPELLVVLALGPVPFTVGITALAWLAPVRPALIGALRG